MSLKRFQNFENYSKKGKNLEALYPYQEQARMLLKETDKNLLVVAPTGAGKTRVGFMALAQSGGKGCYVAPTRALCYEKCRELGEAFPNARVVLGNKDYSLSGRLFRGSDLRVITPWKLNQLLTNDPRAFARFCPTVVVDEAHGLNPDVEIILTKLMLLCPSVQVVALSATVHEDDEPKFTAWLKSLVIKGAERPVPLIERVVHFDADITDDGAEVTNVSVGENGSGVVSRWQAAGSMESDLAVWEVISHIRSQGDESPVLVWTPYRKRAERICNLVAERLRAGGRQWNEELSLAAAELPLGGEFSKALKAVLPWGVGMHHGGMTQQERELVYQLAADGKLDVIVTCMTLAQGVNLPARHVIFESVYDHDDSGQRRLIDISTFRQIQGRAGRPQFDYIGFCWIPVQSEVERVEVEVLLKYKASRIESRLYNEFFLTSQASGLILLGFNTPERLAEFIRATYWGQALQDLRPLVEQFERIVAYCIDHGVAIPVGGRLLLTEKGQKCARLGLHPAEIEVMESLVGSKSLDYDAWVRELGLVQLGDTPDENWHAALGEVVQKGLTVYTAKSNYRSRDLADYVQRMLDITRTFFNVSNTEVAYCEEWDREVAQRFLYGHLELARALSGVLTQSTTKRLVRNAGTVLEKTPGSLTNEEREQIARILYGHFREVWRTREFDKIASALVLSSDEWLDIVQSALAKRGGNNNEG